MPAHHVNYVLIDHENVHSINLEPLSGCDARIILFVGDLQKNLPVSLVAKLSINKGGFEIIQSGGNGKNALDFHMAYHAGQILAHHPQACVHFVTKDKGGFDALVKHLKENNHNASRVDEIKELPFLHSHNNTASTSKISEDPSVQRANRAVSWLGKVSAASRPRKLKTLQSSLHSLFQKQLSEHELTTLVQDLITDGRVVAGQNDSVTYRL